MRFDTLHDQVAKRGQNAYCTVVGMLYSSIPDDPTQERGARHKLRIDIRTDTHVSQAHARIERWDGDKWRFLAHIDPELMATAPNLSYQKCDVTRASFEADVNALLDQARLVLLS